MPSPDDIVEEMEQNQQNFEQNTFDYTFDSSTGTSSPSDDGHIKLNNSTQNSATEAYIKETNIEGHSIEKTLDTIESVTSAIKGHIRIANRTDHSKFLTFAISDLNENNNEGWWILNITHETGSADSPFTNGEDIICSFVTVGDKGDQGIQGTQGVQGSQGVQGLQGVQGVQGIQG